MAKKELKLHVSDDNVITIDDSSGGIRLTHKSPAGECYIYIGPEGITLDNGMGAKITLQGPQTDINSGGLTVI